MPMTLPQDLWAAMLARFENRCARCVIRAEQTRREELLPSYFVAPSVGGVETVDKFDRSAANEFQSDRPRLLRPLR